MTLKELRDRLEALELSGVDPNITVQVLYYNKESRPYFISIDDVHLASDFGQQVLRIEG